ncbi:uncharacterized protein LOC131858191 [Cryptomeria japonica]|uniref:uncharacterized protein LOC131858191 n=1 Tax=Cryptomeria japonica TaxID=3369 RepID=UPI0027DA4AA1|nr:uncharacterized protein LOC131858191 [Cryptomeria japonica]
MQLCSRKDLRVPHSPIITEIPLEQEEQIEVHPQATKSTPIRQPKPTQTVEQELPFPQRLAVKESATIPAFDFLDQLKHVCVKIPLFQAIKDVPIYSKAIREMCLKKPDKKRKDPQIVHVMGQLVDIILGKVAIPKYFDPGSLIVEVTINGVLVKNALIDLGADINVMTKSLMQKLSIMNLRHTPIMLQLADSSTFTPDGVVQDLIVTLDSWEYPIDFLILSPKATLGGNPVILGRPWIATANAYTGCKSRDMTISNGNTTKKLILFPLAKPNGENDPPVWLDLGDEVEGVNSLQSLMMIGRSSILQLQEE